MTSAHSFDPADFPLLREFARGYLHQDVIPEYGSAVRAAKAYVADLTKVERKQLADEAARLRLMIADFPIDDINAAFAKLGSAVTFKSEVELLRVLTALI